MATGRQVLVLVPEIGLTPQLVTRLRKRLGIEPALLHSGLTDAQRHHERQRRQVDGHLVGRHLDRAEPAHQKRDDGEGDHLQLHLDAGNHGRRNVGIVVNAPIISNCLTTAVP